MNKHQSKILELQDYIRKDIDWDTSDINVRIYKHVHTLYPDAEQEKICDGFYKADIYIPSKNTVVEVQGPHHYNGLYPLSPKKRSLTKRRILESLGYRVVEIPAVEFLKNQS